MERLSCSLDLAACGATPSPDVGRSSAMSRFRPRVYPDPGHRVAGDEPRTHAWCSRPRARPWTAINIGLPIGNWTSQLWANVDLDGSTIT
jgi:hypothetical protein